MKYSYGNLKLLGNEQISIIKENLLLKVRDVAQLVYSWFFSPVIRQNMTYVNMAQTGLITNLKEKYMKGYSMQNEKKKSSIFFTLVRFDFLNVCLEFLYDKSVAIQSDNSRI